LRLNSKVLDMVRHFASSRKPIAAICHAPQILTAAGAVEGRKVSAYPSVAPEVNRAGGQYVELAMDQSLVDGNLVTAPAWPAHPAWLSNFLTVLGTRIET
jgi:protease I